MDRTAPGTVELPDSYAKEAGSNNNKWMLLDQLAFDAINKNYEDVYESTDITKAYGATLDKFGQWLDQKRGQLNDPQYRFMLLKSQEEVTSSWPMARLRMILSASSCVMLSIAP